MRYLQYRGGDGMLAWAFHRISGVALFLFILLHVLDIWLAGANPDLYNEVLQLYASPGGRLGETLLGAALLYHALNGLRIIVMDFWPSTTVYHRQMWYASWVIIFGLGIGLLTGIIRNWGGYPEGICYAIMLMNILTPALNDWFRPRRLTAGGAPS